jgi:ATP-dependent DNA helicase RecG
MKAIVHAGYAQQGAPIRVALFDDRLEIENPGLLPFGLTIEDIQKAISKLCNRVVGRVFLELGLIEHWGSGIQRMTAACQDQGLGASQVRRNRHTLSGHPLRRPSQSACDRRTRSVHHRYPNRKVRYRTIDLPSRRQTGVSPRTARTRLASLVERRLVAEIGSGPEDPFGPISFTH